MSNRYDEDPEYLASMALLNEQLAVEQRYPHGSLCFYLAMIEVATPIAEVFEQDLDDLLGTVCLYTMAQLKDQFKQLCQ